jgi:hypothetical protein
MEKLSQMQMELESSKLNSEKYISNLEEMLRKQGREDLYTQARSDADSDFLSGRETTDVSRVGNIFTLAFFDAGYKFKHGITAALIIGKSMGGRSNFFFGLGSGYDYLFDKKIATIPVYFSSKVAIGDGFVDRRSTGLTANGYYAMASVEIGYSILVYDYLNSYSRSGFFGGLGLGGSIELYEAGPIAIIPQVTYRIQNLEKRLANLGVSNELNHTIDFKIGLVISLRR